MSDVNAISSSPEPAQFSLALGGLQSDFSSRAPANGVWREAETTVVDGLNADSLAEGGLASMPSYEQPEVAKDEAASLVQNELQLGLFPRTDAFERRPYKKDCSANQNELRCRITELYSESKPSSESEDHLAIAKSLSQALLQEARRRAFRNASGVSPKSAAVGADSTVVSRQLSANGRVAGKLICQHLIIALRDAGAPA